MDFARTAPKLGTPPGLVRWTLRAAMAVATWFAPACKVPDPPPIEAEGGAWTDDFERDAIGGNYRVTGDNWSIKDGALHARGAYNHPVWLRKQLPRDVEVEFDIWSNSADGDIKVELYGDGYAHAVDRGAYRATAYVLGMGGWNNTLSFIARMDEHGHDRVTRKEPRVERGRRYRWRIVRQGNRLQWFVDGEPFLTFDDPAPLFGEGHRYFGVNNWQSDAYLDNLTVRSL